MKIVLKDNGVATLLDSDEFSSFSVEKADPSMPDAQAVQALGPKAEPCGDGEFWIDADFVRALADRDADQQWQRDFSAMLEKVRPYGWSNEDLTRIRVHLARR